MNIKIIDNGTEIYLPLKTSVIARVLAEVSEEIERIPVGRVTFHFKGRSVIPELTKHFRPVKPEEK